MGHTFDCVIIDYGHGGLTLDGHSVHPGHKEYTFGQVDQDGHPLPETLRGLTVREGVINRMIAWCLMKLLTDRGVVVHDAVAGRHDWKPETSSRHAHQPWRDLEVANIPLGDRISFANGYDNGLLISVHSNAMGTAANPGPGQDVVRGAAVFTSPGQTKADPVATSIWDALSSIVGGLGTRMLTPETTDGDPDYERAFAVLTKTDCAAVLIEGLFFDNIDDAMVLLSGGGRTTLANAYMRGIMAHVEPRRVVQRFGGTTYKPGVLLDDLTVGEVHPAIAERLDRFRYHHLPPHLQAVSKPFSDLAHALALGDNHPKAGNVTTGQGPLEGPALTEALTLLWQAKNAAVYTMVGRG